jgi:hypothetical protein
MSDRKRTKATVIRSTWRQRVLRSPRQTPVAESFAQRVTVLCLAKSGEIVYDASMKTPTVSTNCVHRSLGRSALLFVSFLLACFALTPAVQAVSPPPDGGYAGANTAEGQNALQSLTSGQDNTGLGFQALYHNNGSYNTAEGFRALFSNTSGTQNTATGVNALISNTTGTQNTANGVNTLYHNSTGTQNTATGYQALFSNTTGPFNTAMGSGALSGNTTGDRNTAMGVGALVANSTGASNTAVGVSALRNNTTAAFNTAVGHNALVNNNGNNNTAIGYQALHGNTDGVENTANGYQALYSNATGEYNAANGFEALFNNTTGSENTANGYQALYSNATGVDNTAIGYWAGYDVTGGGNVCIGAFEYGVAGEYNTTRIKNIYYSVASDRAVYVNFDNKLGTLASSRRYKEEIKPMDKASEALLGLKPVTFRYRQELDPHHVPMFGLIAEDVEKVNPDLVTRNKEGEAETVRYEAVNAMLLNEFLKEHRKVEEQEATITQVKSTVAKQEAAIAEQQQEIKALTASVKQQAAQIQKVSDQLEVSKATPQIVVSNQ